MWRDLRHLIDYHHAPQWDSFKGISFCWRCIKGPGRSGLIRLPRLVAVRLNP